MTSSFHQHEKALKTRQLHSTNMASEPLTTDCLVFHPLLTNFFVNEKGGCDIKKACPIYHDDPQIINRLKPCPTAWSDANGRIVSAWFGPEGNNPDATKLTLPLDWRATRFVVDQNNREAPDPATIDGLRFYMAQNPAYDRPWVMHQCKSNGWLSYAEMNRFINHPDYKSIRTKIVNKVYSELLHEFTHVRDVIPSGSKTKAWGERSEE